MRKIEELQYRWRESARSRGLHANPTLRKNGLELGAKTIPVKRNDTGALGHYRQLATNAK